MFVCLLFVFFLGGGDYFAVLQSFWLQFIFSCTIKIFKLNTTVRFNLFSCILFIDIFHNISRELISIHIWLDENIQKFLFYYCFMIGASAFCGPEVHWWLWWDLTNGRKWTTGTPSHPICWQMKQRHSLV